MIAALPPGPLVQAIGWALLHVVWQGALVAGLLAAALALFPGRSHLRYVVSCTALALIVVLGIGTGVRSYRPATTALLPAAAPRMSVIAPSALDPAAAARTVTPWVPDRLQALVSAANDALPRIVAFWIAGVILGSARLILEWLRVRRLQHPDAPLAPEPWPTVTRRIAEALGVRTIVRVLESAAVEVPSVVGLLRPAILIPASTLAGLAPSQLEMILAHELAHVRRHDFLVNLLQAVVETLLFYHPAVWWVSRQIRVERENCCDDLAVLVCGDRLRYARALLRLEELRAQRLAFAMSADGGSLIQRIRRIALGSTQASGSAVRAVGAFAVPLVVLFAIAVPSIPSIRRPEPTGPPVSAATISTPPETGASDPIRKPDRDAQLAPEPAPAAGEVTAAAGSDPIRADGGGDIPDPDKPSLDELIEARVQNVTPEDIREIRSLLGEVSLRDIAAMKGGGASPEFVREMRRAGLAVRTVQEAQGLAALGVTPEYVDGLHEAGIDVSDSDDVSSLRAMGVAPAFIHWLAAAGYKNLSVKDLTRLAAAGVTGDFVREMSRYRARGTVARGPARHMKGRTR